MSKKYYLPAGDTDRVKWFDNFVSKLINTYATIFGLTKTQTTSLTNDNAAFKYSVTLIEAAKTFFHSCTHFKTILRNEKSNTTVQNFPVFTPPAGAPTAVPQGIFDRVTTLVGQLKANSAYTDIIGQDLGIVGADGGHEFDSAKPVLTIKTVGGSTQGKYKKAGTDGIMVESMRGTESSFTLLTRVTKTTFTDNRPNLVPGTPEVRQYRAWYVVNDEVVGLVSDVVSFTVAG